MGTNQLPANLFHVLLVWLHLLKSGMFKNERMWTNTSSAITQSSSPESVRTWSGDKASEFDIEGGSWLLLLELNIKPKEAVVPIAFEWQSVGRPLLVVLWWTNDWDSTQVSGCEFQGETNTFALFLPQIWIPFSLHNPDRTANVSVCILFFHFASDHWVDKFPAGIKSVSRWERRIRSVSKRGLEKSYN